MRDIMNELENISSNIDAALYNVDDRDDMEAMIERELPNIHRIINDIKTNKKGESAMRDINIDLLKRFKLEVLSITEDNVSEKIEMVINKYLIELIFNCLEAGEKNEVVINTIEVVSVLKEMENILKIKCTSNVDNGKEKFLDTMVDMNRIIQANNINIYILKIESMDREVSDKKIKNVFFF